MAFAIDDSNPVNPLPLQRPEDLGFSSWSDFLININSNMSSNIFNKLPVAGQCDQLSCAIHDLTFFFVAQLFEKPKKGGNT